MKLTLKIIMEIISWGLLIGLAVIIGLTTMSNFSIFGKYRSFLVQSGSMEPAIMTGDIIITKSNNQYEKNDVVTFEDYQQRRVTHRIIDSQNNGHLITKGDANRSKDNEDITKDQILGKVILIIPRLGYLVSFSKSLPGFLLFIIVPGILIIISESIKIKKQVSLS
jgi:signal peptidase